MKLLRTISAVLFFAAFLSGGAAFAADPSKDIVLRGDARCTKCHDESDSPKLLAIGKTKHGTRADGRTPSCTSCHGESDSHVSYKGKDTPPKPDIVFGKKVLAELSNQGCIGCHQGGKHMNWNTSTHGARDVACTSCHQVHSSHDKVRDKRSQPEVCFTCHKEQRMQVSKPSHHPILEGKMTCSDCHNVHGDNPKQLSKSSTNETCYTCHMEKRGPFIHNHQPVAEDCSICHNPHGTTTAALLKTRPPFLCQECHNHDSHPGQAASLPTARSTSSSVVGTVGRACMNCHTNIHGGNSTVNSATSGRFRR